MKRIPLVALCLSLTTLARCGGGSGPAFGNQEVPPDTTPPVTVASPEGGDFGTDTVVTLTASEEATVFVSVNGADFAPAGPSPVSVPLSEGTTTLRYYAVDLAGNRETPEHVAQYFVDLSPPVLTLPGGDPAPVPWLGSADVDWQSDEDCDYTVTVVGSGDVLDEGSLTGGETASIHYSGLDLVDAPASIRIDATDWTGRTSQLQFELRIATAKRIAVTAVPGDVIVLPSGDRAFVARTFGTAIDVLDLDTEELVDAIDVGIRAWAVTLNAETSTLYVSNAVSTGKIAAVDTDTYDVDPLSGYVGIPGAVAFSTDGTLGFFTDFDGGVMVLDTDPSSPDYHTVVDRIPVDSDVLSGRLAVGPQDDLLLLNWNGLDSCGLEMITLGASGPDLRNAWTSSVPRLNGQSNAIVLSADGTQVCLCSVELLGGLCRVDLEADRLVQASGDPVDASGQTVTVGGEEVPDLPWGLALIDDDAELLTVGANGKFLRLYDTETMELRSYLEIGSGARSIAVTPDGTRAVISRSEGADREILVLPLR